MKNIRDIISERPSMDYTLFKSLATKDYKRFMWTTMMLMNYIREDTIGGWIRIIPLSTAEEL